MEITYEIIQELFDYDPEGYLVWKKSLNNQFAGQRAGGVHHKYWEIQLTRFNKKVRAHRMIFLWHHGYLPKMVDHVNRNKLDNRIENLREATPTQQNANKGIDPRSTTGFKGVAYDKQKNKYRARIRVNGKRVNLGRFKTPEEAHSAYVKAATEIFGEFACEG